MLPAFSNAVAAIKPGQIAPSLVETTYGYHIVQRLPYTAVKDQYGPAYAQVAVGKADSTYLANLDKAAKVEVKANGPALAKAAAGDPAKHHDDNAVLATYKGGDLTTNEFLGWLETFPPNMQVTRQLQQAPDSLVRQFVSSIAQREVMLEKADSAKIGLSAEEQNQLYGQFSQFVTMVESQLGIDPKSLADSAKTAPERERLAASRIEAYIDRILGGQAQPVPIPQPIATVLRSKYEWSVNAAGIDRAVERAQKIRATADSTRAANQPKSQVPLPGAPAGPGAGAQPPSQVPLPQPGAKPPAKSP